MQTDAELSDILMRAFILRRVELIARRLRRRRPDWLDALRRHAAREGVPDAQRPSVSSTSTSIATPTRRSCSIAFM